MQPKDGKENLLGTGRSMTKTNAIESKLKADLLLLSGKPCIAIKKDLDDSLGLTFGSLEEYEIHTEAYADWQFFNKAGVALSSTESLPGKPLDVVAIDIEYSSVLMIFNDKSEIRIQPSKRDWRSLPNNNAIWSFYVNETTYFLMPNGEIEHHDDQEGVITDQLNCFRLEM